MTAELIAYPFRLASNGEVVTHMDDDDDYYAEELAGLVQTEPGERPLVPDYGIEDPAFNEWPEEELGAKLEMFGPPVEISSVDIEFLQDGVCDMLLSFQRRNVSLDAPEDYDMDDNDEDDQLLTEADVYGI